MAGVRLAAWLAGKAASSIKSNGVNMTRSRASKPKLPKAQESATADSMEKNRMKPTNGWERQCETEYRRPRRLIQNNHSRNIPSALAIRVWPLLISQGNGRNGSAGAIRMRLTSEPPSKLEPP